eukprot:TRINITY_DN10388_c0_g1_i1.p1 TRINITY_DN10388_c0_g1~~TRINITY_DN10388_c0_g1_i1.p1  ORF type:complete len:221 (+),score=53.07 TRINITY_DN10388_c0_g1_i1:60-665(+)
MKGLVYKRPVIYGTIAYWLGKKADAKHTHRWTCYLRGPANEDLSHFIKKVVFTLHSSFEKPKRAVEAPPYEITETGWGEFQIAMRIYFVDSTEKSIDTFFPLCLYGSDPTPQSMSKPVITEMYDEIVFVEPNTAFYKRLINNPPPEHILPHPLAPTQETNFDEEKELERLGQIYTEVKSNLSGLIEQCLKIQNEISQLKQM